MTYSLDKILTDIGANMALDMEIKAYPNPATDELTINMPAAKKPSVKIFSVDGKQMPCNSNGSSSMTVNVSSYPAGIYYFVAEEGKHRAVKKFVKS